MKINSFYSHLNGYEFLQYHKPAMWGEIVAAIEAVDAQACKTKISKEARTMDKLLFSPKDMNSSINNQLSKHGWSEERTSYWVTGDAKLIRRTMGLAPAEQKAEIEAAGLEPLFSYNQTDFVKDRVAIELQLESTRL